MASRSLTTSAAPRGDKSAIVAAIVTFVVGFTQLCQGVVIAVPDGGPEGGNVLHVEVNANTGTEHGLLRVGFAMLVAKMIYFGASIKGALTK